MALAGKRPRVRAMIDGMERKLDAVRRDIDAIDDNIQDLLIRRTDLVHEVRRIKQDWRVKIQPSREAQIVYRLLERHHGGFPRRDLVAIWRILICATLSFEGPFSVAVLGASEGHPEDGRWLELAREHFGPCTQLTRHSSSRKVIEAVHRQEATVGVLPLPGPEDADPWWRHLLTNQTDAPRVIARLPFVLPASGRAPGSEALVICPVTLVPTGRDRAYLAAEVRERLGLNQLTQLLRDAGFVVHFATVQRNVEAPETWLFLSEVDGLLAADDPRLHALLHLPGRPFQQVLSLGGYALPVILNNNVESKDGSCANTQDTAR